MCRGTICRPNTGSSHFFTSFLSTLKILGYFITLTFWIFSYMVDYVTDIIAVFLYAFRGNDYWALLTLSFILLSQIVCSIFAIWLYKRHHFLYPRLFGGYVSYFSSFIAFFLNLGPVVLMIDLLLDKVKRIKVMAANDVAQREILKTEIQLKRKHLAYICIAEAVCESLGQAILQMYILSYSIGQENLFVPREMEVKNGIWLNQTLSEINPNGSLQQSHSDCIYWKTTGPLNCWSQHLSHKVSESNNVGA